MPEHYHIVVEFQEANDLQKWLHDMQWHTAKAISKWLMHTGYTNELDTFAKHANGNAKLAIWKEQARAVGIISEHVLRTKIQYIHNNPVGRKLVDEPSQWLWSSWRNYHLDDENIFQVDKIVIFQLVVALDQGFRETVSRNNKKYLDANGKWVIPIIIGGIVYTGACGGISAALASAESALNFTDENGCVAIYHNRDKRIHCIASCYISKCGGRIMAWMLGWMKEIRDYWYPIHWPWVPGEVDLGDYEANDDGRACSKVEGKSCAECCNAKYPKPY